MQKLKLNSELIKKEIKRRGWSIAQCGRRMGFKSPQAFHYILNNQCVEYARAFADFFEIDKNSLIL